MHDLLRMATAEIARFLAAKLPSLGPDWWTKHVLNRLSFQQQRTARDRDFQKLQQLDFAALLRVLDQNWHELKDNIPSAYEARSWVKELPTVRNKWAHLSAEAMPASEVYRDADTLGRLLKILGAASTSLDAVESLKAATVTSRGRPTSGNTPSPSPAETSQPANADTPRPEAAPMAQIKTLFKVGDLVALRSSPNTMFPVSEVISR